MSKANEFLLKAVAVSVAMLAATLLEPRVQATPLVLTEINPSTMTATINQVPFGSLAYHVPNVFYFELESGIMLPSGDLCWWSQAWQRNTGPDATKVINVTVSHSSLETAISFIAIGTGFPLSTPFIGPKLQDGATAPFPQNEYFSGIQFVDLKDTASVPDDTSTCLLLCLGGITLYGLSLIHI